MQNKHKATVALMVSGIGAFLTLSATGGLGRLVHHGFVAATVGGLADWFAVTALFRKPLGVIGYRTQILRRNRQRIMEAIVTFAADDMLSVKNIMAQLARENTAKLFIAYLTERGGREKINKALSTALLSLANTIEPERIAAVLTPTVKAGLESFGSQKIWQTVLELLSEARHSRPLLLSLLEMSREILHTPILQHFLKENIHGFRQNYARDSTGRMLILSALDLTDERILALINEKAETYLTAALTGDNEALDELENAFGQFLADLRQNDDVSKTLQAWQKKIFGEAGHCGAFERMAG